MPESSLLNGENLLAGAGQYIIYPLSVITRILPTASTLLFLQSLALSLAVVPLFYIARNLGKLHFGTSSALVFVYGVSTSVHSANLSGFSPEALALPAIFYALYLGLSTGGDGSQGGGRLTQLGWKFHTKYFLLIAFILACRADLGLAMAGFGLLLIFEKKRQLGLVTFGLAFGWLLLSVLVFQTLLGDGFSAIESFSSYGSNPFSVVWGMITDPAQVITDLRTEQNIISVIGLLAPLVFLPLVRPLYILPVVPLYFFYLLADVEANQLGEAEQAIPVIAFLFLATVFALKRIGTVLVERVRVNLYIILVLILAALLLFIQDSRSSFYNEPWHWNDRQAVLEEAVAKVPKDEASINTRVGATTNLLSSLAERKNLFEIKLPENISDTMPKDVVRQARGAHWILIDSAVFGRNQQQRDNVVEAMVADGWKKSEVGQKSEASIEPEASAESKAEQVPIYIFQR